jgi:hypothetical protein
MSFRLGSFIAAATQMAAEASVSTPNKVAVVMTGRAPEVQRQSSRLFVPMATRPGVIAAAATAAA